MELFILSRDENERVPGSASNTTAERAVRDITSLMGGRLLTAHVVDVLGVYHQNPECPEVEPGDDLLPRRGAMVEVDLPTLIRTSECGYCRNYFRDHGPGTKELTRLAAGVISMAGVLRGEVSRGAAINLLCRNWLVPGDFVTEALATLWDDRADPLSDLFALVERGGLASEEQESRLSRALWHWEDGWSVVEYNEQDTWRKSCFLGRAEISRARATAKVYAEVTKPLFRDQAEAWRAAVCVS